MTPAWRCMGPRLVQHGGCVASSTGSRAHACVRARVRAAARGVSATRLAGRCAQPRPHPSAVPPTTAASPGQGAPAQQGVLPGPAQGAQHVRQPDHRAPRAADPGQGAAGGAGGPARGPLHTHTRACMGAAVPQGRACVWGVHSVLHALKRPFPPPAWPATLGPTQDIVGRFPDLYSEFEQFLTRIEESNSFENVRCGDARQPGARQAAAAPAVGGARRWPRPRPARCATLSASQPPTHPASYAPPGPAQDIKHIAATGGAARVTQRDIQRIRSGAGKDRWQNKPISEIAADMAAEDKTDRCSDRWGGGGWGRGGCAHLSGRAGPAAAARRARAWWAPRCQLDLGLSLPCYRQRPAHDRPRPSTTSHGPTPSPFKRPPLTATSSTPPACRRSSAAAATRCAGRC